MFLLQSSLWLLQTVCVYMPQYKATNLPSPMLLLRPVAGCPSFTVQHLALAHPLKVPECYLRSGPSCL